MTRQEECELEALIDRFSGSYVNSIYNQKLLKRLKELRTKALLEAVQRKQDKFKNNLKSL